MHNDLSNEAVTPSRKPSRKSHVKQFSQNGMGRGYFVAVTESTWQLRVIPWGKGVQDFDKNLNTIGHQETEWARYIDPWIHVTSPNTLLNSDVTSRDQVVRCRGSQECGSRFVNFAC